MSAADTIPHAGERTDLNINETVQVKLTFEGIRILKERHEDLRHRVPSISEWRVPRTDKDGWSEFQLWSLMQIFGPHITMGGPNPFETTIQVPKPKDQHP